jgi:hypothetical protein
MNNKKQQSVSFHEVSLEHDTAKAKSEAVAYKK